MTRRVVSVSVHGGYFYEDAANRDGNKLTVPEAALPQLDDAMDAYQQSQVD